MADFSGVRPWMRGLASKIAASAATLGAAELLVDEQGNVYGGNGGVVSALKRLVRVDEVTTAVQTYVSGLVVTSSTLAALAAESGYVWALVDQNGRIALGVTPTGKVIGNITLAAGTLTVSAFDPTTQSLLPQSIVTEQAGSFVYAITDPAGHVPFGIAPDGSVSIPKPAFGAGSINAASLSAALQAAIPQPAAVESGYVFSVTDSAGRIGFGLTQDGTFTAAKTSFPAYSMRDSITAAYRAFPYKDTAGKFQIRVTRRSDGTIVKDTAGQAYNTVEPILDPANKLIYRTDQTGTMTTLWTPAEGGASWQMVADTATQDDWGDSLTYGNGATNGATDPYPAKVASTLGITGNNYGIGGQTTDMIAARQGGTPALLTVTSNQIPASGAVAVTALSVRLLSTPATNAARSMTGTLAGVPGTLAHDASGTTGTISTDAYTFTRTTSGSTVACPAGTPFIPDAAVATQTRTQVLWPGRNDANAGSFDTIGGAGTTAFLALLASMVGWQKSYQPRFVVLSVLTGAGETTGTARHDGIVAVNNQLATVYGGNYIDVRNLIIANAASIMAAAGITPTSQDTTDLAGDTIPVSLRSDTQHLNTASYGYVAAQIVANQRARKWYS